MADPVGRSPLAGAGTPEAGAWTLAPDVPGLGVIIRDMTGRTMWRAWNGSADIGRVRTDGDVTEFSTSPGESTYASDGPVPEDGVDLTHVRVTVRIEGPRAAELLMRLTPLDLTDDMFVTGSAARTLVAGITAEILRVSDDAYLLIASRSFAHSLMSAIERALATLAG